MQTRRSTLRMLALAILPASSYSQSTNRLPLSRTFVGLKEYEQIIDQARREKWAFLPMGDRVARVGQAMVGTPYVGYTLEIDDYIEAPSANFTGQDCWTFFEIALCIARLLGRSQSDTSPQSLLREIENTRYRGGICNSNYLDRIHYLDEWYRDNDKRGNIRDITQRLGPTTHIKGRKIDEMTVLWKSYRYLRKDPSLRSGMARIEAELQKHPFRYLRKELVPEREAQLKSGDIIGIVTHKPHVYCSHVGIAVKTSDGRCRLMHASTTHKKVVLDKPISLYLNDFQNHAGIVVARPEET